MARHRKEPEAQVQTEAAQAQIDQTPKKKGTPPGWRPAGQTPRLKAPPGFTPKWANPEKLDKLRAEGWVVMKHEDNKGDPILRVDVNDGSSLTGAIRYREMVAVMLPNDLKAARDEWVRNENKEAMKGILTETDEKFNVMGVQTYAPPGQSGRIIID